MTRNNATRPGYWQPTDDDVLRIIEEHGASSLSRLQRLLDQEGGTRARVDWYALRQLVTAMADAHELEVTVVARGRGTGRGPFMEYRTAAH